MEGRSPRSRIARGESNANYVSISSRRRVAVGFFAFFLLLSLAPEGWATPFSTSVSLCLGVGPGTCLVKGGPGYPSVENEISFGGADTLEVLGRASLTKGEVQVLTEQDASFGFPQTSAAAQMLDTVFLKAPSGTKGISGYLRWFLENGEFTGPSAYSALIRSPERGNSSAPICSDAASNAYFGAGVHARNLEVDLRCSFSVKPNLFYDDHVEFHLPFEAFVQVFANGNHSRAALVDTAILSIIIDTPGVTFTSESSVLLSDAGPSTSEVPEPGTLVLLGSGFVWCLRGRMRRRPDLNFTAGTSPPVISILMDTVLPLEMQMPQAVGVA